MSRPPAGEDSAPAPGSAAPVRAEATGSAASSGADASGSAASSGADDWLTRLSADEWLRAGVGELERAERALAAHDRARAVATLKRAAGMALNAALRVAPAAGWGRSYVDHLRGLAADAGAPAAVRAAAARVLEARPPSGPVVVLGGPSGDAALLEAARTVMAHAYACVVRAAEPAARGDSPADGDG